MLLLQSSEIPSLTHHQIIHSNCPMRPVALFKNLNKAIISTLEWTFVLGIYASLTLTCYYCLFVVGSYYHHSRHQPLLDLCLCLLFFWLVFNILFNYFMLITTSPGIARDDLPGIQRVTKHCKICEQPKPPQTRHCKICDKCVLQLDHHFPFAHACVGLFNRRYHLNTITHTESLLLALLVLNEPICYALQLEYLFSVQILLTTLSIINGVYTLLCWYLVFTGRTLVEFLKREPVQVVRSVGDNLKFVFGVNNLLKCILPGVGGLTSDGIRWMETLDPHESVEISNLSM